MIFRSSQPRIDVPNDKTIWRWLDEQAFQRQTKRTTSGYTDVDTQERITYLQLQQCAISLSTALTIEYGVRPGDSVTIFSPNSIWYPVVMFAALRIGARVSGVSPTYTKEELAFALQKTNAKILWTTSELVPVATAAVQSLGSSECKLLLLEGQIGRETEHRTLDSLVQAARSVKLQVPEYQIPPGRTNKDVCAFLNFSSGTTGLPKAVIISHQNVIAQCLQVEQITPADHRRVLGALPVFHIQGLIHILHVPVVLNAEVYLMRKFSLEVMLDAVSKYEPRELCLVPPIIIQLAKSPLVDNYDLSSIRRFFSGAAPLSDGILQVLQERFPQTGFKQGYGLTESCSAITLHAPGMFGYENAGFGGKLVANTEIKICSVEDGRELGVEETGEILARGPQITEGYLDNPQATISTFDEDGWLHTGDVGRMNKDGWLIVSDRIKDLIKVNGIGVAPAELEDLLLTHDQVDSCAVIGTPDDYTGEKPLAYVALKSANRSSEEKEAIGAELLQLVRKRRARHKWLSEIRFVPSIPKSPTGKILKRQLREARPRDSDTFAVKANSARTSRAEMPYAKL